jgi:hypothetical protein
MWTVSDYDERHDYDGYWVTVTRLSGVWWDYDGLFGNSFGDTRYPLVLWTIDVYTVDKYYALRPMGFSRSNLNYE